VKFFPLLLSLLHLFSEAGMATIIVSVSSCISLIYATQPSLYWERRGEMSSKQGIAPPDLGGEPCIWRRFKVFYPLLSKTRGSRWAMSLLAMLTTLLLGIFARSCSLIYFGQPD
jgi:hypothetical protein